MSSSYSHNILDYLAAEISRAEEEGRYEEMKAMDAAFEEIQRLRAELERLRDSLDRVIRFTF